MMILIRSFSKPLIYAFTFSLACIPIVWVVIDFLSGTVLRNRHFMDILSQQLPLQFLLTLIAVSIVCLPIYAWKSYKMLALFPRYFTKDHDSPSLYRQLFS